MVPILSLYPAHRKDIDRWLASCYPVLMQTQTLSNGKTFANSPGWPGKKVWLCYHRRLVPSFYPKDSTCLAWKGEVAMTVNVSWRHAPCPIAGASISASVILTFLLQNYLLWHLIAHLKGEEPIPYVAHRVLTICSQLVSLIFLPPPPNHIHLVTCCLSPFPVTMAKC